MFPRLVILEKKHRINNMCNINSAFLNRPDKRSVFLEIRCYEDTRDKWVFNSIYTNIDGQYYLITVAVKTENKRYYKQILVRFNDKNTGKIKGIIRQYGIVWRNAILNEIYRSTICSSYLDYETAKKIFKTGGFDILWRVCEAIREAWNDCYTR